MFLLQRRRAVSVLRSESNLQQRGRQRPRSLECLGSFSGCSSCGYMNTTAAFAKETAAAIRKDRGNLGHNREPDFFGRFAADVDPCRRVEISHTRVEIEWSMFTEARQQFGMALSWPEQSNVAELERQKTIEREKIATKI